MWDFELPVLPPCSFTKMEDLWYWETRPGRRTEVPVLQVLCGRKVVIWVES